MERFLEHAVHESLEDHQIASITVTVVDENGPIYERAFGYADVENRRPATLDTPYRWGSNAKVFVLLSLLQLAEQGKVSFDAPLTRYIPEFTIGPPPDHLPESKDWKLEQITIRRMLTHHSGLPNDILSRFLSTKPVPYRSFVKQLKGMRAQAPVDLVHSYSNVAYALLGIVVENVSGMTFDEYVKKHLFHPMAMDGASYTWNERLEKSVARPYDQDGKQRPIYKVSTVPGGALIATTREMGRFATAILRGGVGQRGRFVEHASLLASYRRQNAHVALDFDNEMGLTWFVNHLPQDRFGFNVSHGGAILSHHTAFAALPDVGVAALVATNSQRGAGETGRIMVEALALGREVKTGHPGGWVRPLEPVRQARGIDEAELHRWVGHYATPGGSLHVTRDGDQLTFLAGDRRLFLKPLIDGKMGMWADLWGVLDIQPGNMNVMRISLLDVAGRRVGVVEVPRGYRYMGVAYEPSKATAPWKKRVGVYLAEPDPDSFRFAEGVRLFLQGEQLMVQPLLVGEASGVPPSAALHIVDDHSAVSEGLGRNQGVWLTADAKGVLHLAGLHLHKAPPPASE